MKPLNMIFCLLLTYLVSFPCLAKIEQQPVVDKFINMMVDKHQFDPTKLERLFQQVEIKDQILESISSPAEGMPWYKYRKIFITDTRIDGGVEFWQQNEAILAKVEQQYGVPAEILIAILGVETRYGQNSGRYRVIDALSTLAFAYPKRSRFFLSELKHYLILCREENRNPLEPIGSYAGAMGMPQFMPSSYRAYAVDYDGDKRRNIWTDPGDVVASVANYLNRHHWQTGKGITFSVSAIPEIYKEALNPGLKPDITAKELNVLGVQTPEDMPLSTKVKLFSFSTENVDELWVGLDNFYTITRYNHSPLYAMAVFQLSQAIHDKKTGIDN